MVSLVKMLGDRFQLLILYVTAMLTEAVRQLLTRLANVLFAAALTYDTVNQVAAGVTEMVLGKMLQHVKTNKNTKAHAVM